MSSVDAVALVDEWVKDDLSGAAVTDADRRNFFRRNRDTTYDRDLDQIVARAEEIDPE